MDIQQFVYNVFLQVPGLLLAIVIRDAAQAWMSLRFGDPTPQMNGRLSLNPAAHFDMLGTLIFPLVGAFFGGLMYGWGKPVLTQSRYYKNIRKGLFFVSFSGPMANTLVAFLLACIMGILSMNAILPQEWSSIVILILDKAVMINMLIAGFNLLPLPPLDGSKMLGAILPYNALKIYQRIERESFLIFIVLLLTGALSYLLAPALILGRIFIQIGLFVGSLV